MTQVDEVISQKINDGEIISKIADIQKLLPEGNKAKTRKRMVSRGLREGFDMTYRRILKLSWKQNSDKNLILR